MDFEQLFANFNTGPIDALIKGFEPSLIDELIKFNPNILDWVK